jgi:hypothetical protein
MVNQNVSVSRSLANGIINRVENLMREAEQAGKPLEVDPYRDQLFELFVTAEGAGFLEEDSDLDLTADGLCGALANLWDLADATRESFQQQKKLPPEQLRKMRLLWSVMRMWMEWSYSWKRWEEFHQGRADKG